MNSTHVFRFSGTKSRILDCLAVAALSGLMALHLAARAADPDLSNLDKEAVVKKPSATPARRTRGFSMQPATPAKTAPTRGYDPTRGVVTIEEVDGTVKELPYVVLPILFKVNSDEFFDAQSEENLRKLAAKLQEPQLLAARFVVEGHTSTEGASEYNQTLSDRRANRIFNLLVDKFKVEKERLSAKGFGLTAPEVKPELTEQDRQRNRRVLIVKESNGQ
jgi:outer membrane protein OmpA-like peptidoglycan-associated protein